MPSLRRSFRLLLLIVLAGAWAGPARAQQDLWLMKAHDVRRTGQSRINGPQGLDPEQSWTVEVPGAHTINIGATVTARGAFYGSWGLLRRNPDNPDPRTWDKADGQLFGVDLTTGASLWGGPLDLDLVPRCYDFADRGPNVLWCGLTPYEVSFYNGTVEGQAAVDTSRGVLYVGRGDGKLFAVDPEAGAVRWRFETFNPQLPEDPDGGGEVVSAPLLGPDGTVYFGTWGAGPYETDAVYAVNPDGALQWRYPSETSLTHRVFAAPALSPDGSTIYVSTFRDDDGTQPATLYAFHREPTDPASDAQRLKWTLTLESDGMPVHTVTLAVGSDGTVYVGGYMLDGFALVPAVVAVEDQSDAPALKWTTPYVELRDGAQFVLGIALREVNGATQRLYVSTANLGTPLFNGLESGQLYAVDPATGAVLASYDPSDDVPDAVGGINSPAIGADGTVYVGVRGRFGSNAVDGQYVAVTYDEQAARFDLMWHTPVDGYVGNHPAIGPDGGLYVGSSSQDEVARTPTYDEGTAPEGTTAYLHALKGPTTPVVIEHEAPTPAIQLATPYPNPFTNRTRLSFDLPRSGAVQMEVFDVLGRRVRVLHDGVLAAGRHTLTWDGITGDGSAPAGIYVMRLRTQDSATQARMVVRQR